jgi:hypothetical protein
MPAPSPLPPADAIKKIAADVVARPYYEINSAGHREGDPYMLQLLRWLFHPLFALFDKMSGLPPVIQWLVVIICVVALLLVVGHIVSTLVGAVRVSPLRRGKQFVLSAQEVDPIRLEQEAERAGATGDFIYAIRLLMRAALRRIEMAEKRKLRPGITNRELLRRYQATPLKESLQRFVNTIELKWYGDVPCDQMDYMLCHTEHARICEFVRNYAAANTP